MVEMKGNADWFWEKREGIKWDFINRRSL